MDVKLKKRKLLFQQVITCPNHHDTICNVYTDNGYLYYECPVCKLIVGLQTDELKDTEPRSKRMKINKDIPIKFTGNNAVQIQNIFIMRNKERKINEGKK
jgi:hypothetical protein